MKKLNKDNEEADKQLILPGLQVCTPVYFCSIETSSEAEEKRLLYALNCLQREDPTLVVSSDETNNLGQVIIEGMGELHLEIIKDRLKKEYGLDVYFGKLQIAYKEQPTQSAHENLRFEKIVNAVKNTINIEMTVVPRENHIFKGVQLKLSDDEQLRAFNNEYLNAVNHGVKSAFNSGKWKFF